MPLLTLLITCPFVLIAISYNSAKESLLILKLFGFWLLSLMYITVNDNFRIPLGIICAILFIHKSKTNRKSKLIALIIGLISFALSSLTYLFYKI